MVATSGPCEAGTGQAWAGRGAPAGAAAGISALEAEEGSDLVRDLHRKAKSSTLTLFLQSGGSGEGKL